MHNTELYDSQFLHLHFSMSAGASVHLRLFEGGYVSYSPLDWYAVKIPDDIFNSLINICK